MCNDPKRAVRESVKTHHCCRVHGAQELVKAKAVTCQGDGCSNLIHAGLSLCIYCARKKKLCQLCLKNPAMREC